MNRVVACGLALCLCLGTQAAFAQGLLGKPSVTAQYLLFRAGDDFDGFDTDLGHGGRLQVSIPVIVPDSEAAWGAGLDGFGTFSGLGLEVRNPAFPDLPADVTFWGGDLGANFYTRVTEHIRPFAQLGINWTRSEAQISGGPRLQETETNLILAAGVEFDVFSSTAVRASYGRGGDGFGHTAFLGELIVHPADHWFGRISASVGNDKTVIGGFGLGYAW